jgi:hypothetical protein
VKIEFGFDGTEHIAKITDVIDFRVFNPTLAPLKMELDVSSPTCFFVSLDHERGKASGLLMTPIPIVDAWSRCIVGFAMRFD